MKGKGRALGCLCYNSTSREMLGEQEPGRGQAQWGVVGDLTYVLK